MKLHTISVALTYNIGDYESKRADVTVKLKTGDTTKKARQFAAEQCALIISNGVPEVYKECLAKIHGEVNLTTVQELHKERRKILE